MEDYTIAATKYKEKPWLHKNGEGLHALRGARDGFRFASVSPRNADAIRVLSGGVAAYSAVTAFTGWLARTKPRYRVALYPLGIALVSTFTFGVGYELGATVYAFGKKTGAAALAFAEGACCDVGLIAETTEET